jgi:signal transduction histidine kinase
LRELVDLDRLLPAVVDEMALRAGKGGVALNQEIDPDLPAVSADPAGLRTMLVNLLDNALQYTPPGGRVTVRARASSPQAGVWIQVTDTGSGIAEDDLAHIFERFYRADKARRRSTGVAGSGAGLGLAIVKGIVEDHGGTISAQSVPDQGTEISVWLPADTT